MIFIKLFILFLLSISLQSKEMYFDTISLSKVKKLVKKEEEIAFAYKKYILEKGTNPTTLATLINNDYLPKGFTTRNPFGKEIKFDTTIPYKIETSIPDNINLKTNLFDYYYSSKYRKYTKAPLSIYNNKIEIILSSKEKFIYDNQSDITTSKADAINKYYLDENSILHWHGDLGAYKFSVAKDLIVDDSVTISTNGIIDSTFKSMIAAVTFSGQTILHKNSITNKAEEYVLIDDSIIKKSVAASSSTQVALLQFGKHSGGMIVNGDIYTWGNNSNRITGINLDTYTESGSNGNKNPVITTLVKQKAKVYDDSTDGKDLSKFYEQNYFSSPFKPKFVDLFSNTKNGTCGITNDGELFCGGTTGANYIFGTNFTHVDAVRKGEMLYRSTYFDGITNKAKKVFANNQLWLILAEDGFIYRWGTEDTYENGFSGNGTESFNKDTVTTIETIIQVINPKCTKKNKKDEYKCKPKDEPLYIDEIITTTNTISKDINKSPEKITENVVGVSFTEMSYIFSDGYKKMGALTSTKDIYVWGMDTEITNSMSCSEVSGINLCEPTKVDTSTSNLREDLFFESIQGGVRAFIALATDGKYYKIDQPKTNKFQVNEIKNGTDSLPSDILSLDLTADGTAVYVSADNKLISTHFDSFDTTFKNTINGMLWKSIKVLDDTDNAMCGINTDNQMYCWGMQSYYDSTNTESNTFMLPVFNTNLYDLDKDFLVAEGGTSYLTKMTSGDWNPSGNNFFIKYPTYIGGFNYEFEFK